MRGRGKKHYFVNFFVWECFNHRWMRVGGAGQKVSFAFLFLVSHKEMRMQSQSCL